MTRRMGQRQPQKIGDVLARVLKKTGIRLPVEDNRLKDVWNKTVGPMIADQTCPGQIKGGMLFITVATSIWMYQLQFLRQDILDKFQNVWPGAPVDRLHFSVGDVSAFPASADRDFFHPTASLLKKRDKLMIEESLTAVKDPELQSLLKRAMIKELMRRRYLEHHGISPA